MRDIPLSIQNTLEAGAATLCHVWLITRKDGVVMGFSDHDLCLNFKGTECQPQSGLTKGAVQSELGLSSPGDASVSGILDSASIKRVDIEAGLYDEARLEAYRVNWQVPADYVLLSSGYMMRLECRGGLDDGQGQFIAHIEGLSGRLERTIGQRYGHTCDALLGDARCGINLLTAPSLVCNKLYKTCHETFNNRLNFRGFPDLPGEDYLTLYARNNTNMDGGSRAQGSGR
jgi:hypothetical protein